jgi:hypothetical protein
MTFHTFGMFHWLEIRHMSCPPKERDFTKGKAWSLWGRTTNDHLKFDTQNFPVTLEINE